MNDNRIERAVETLAWVLRLMRDVDPPPNAPLLVEEWVEQAITTLKPEWAGVVDEEDYTRCADCDGGFGPGEWADRIEVNGKCYHSYCNIGGRDE